MYVLVSKGEERGVGRGRGRRGRRFWQRKHMSKSPEGVTTHLGTKTSVLESREEGTRLEVRLER